MTEYEVVITKRTPNPDWKPRPTSPYYGDREPETPRYLEQQVLSVTVDEATFAAFRKAAVETL